MFAHHFSHDRIAYEVGFKRMDGQWFALLRQVGTASARPLPPFSAEEFGRLSDHAIRAGYIRLAEWLVEEGGVEWIEIPPLDGDRGALVVSRDKPVPSLDRNAQEHLGKELRAMYAEIMDAPLPHNLAALLGADRSDSQPSLADR